MSPWTQALCTNECHRYSSSGSIAGTWCVSLLEKSLKVLSTHQGPKNLYQPCTSSTNIFSERNFSANCLHWHLCLVWQAGRQFSYLLSLSMGVTFAWENYRIKANQFAKQWGSLFRLVYWCCSYPDVLSSLNISIFWNYVGFVAGALVPTTTVKEVAATTADCTRNAEQYIQSWVEYCSCSSSTFSLWLQRELEW